MSKSFRAFTALAIMIAIVGLFAGWSTRGTGFNREVLAIGEGSLFQVDYPVVGGRFTDAGGQSAKRLAYWDGVDEQWKEFGGGTNGAVRAMTTFNGDLIIGGDFTRAGNVVVNGVARWDGTRWRPLGDGVNGQVHALVVHGSSLYVGGDFTQAGAVNARNVARWTGSSWKSMGPGFNRAVKALESYAGHVYAGGDFTRSGNRRVNGIARWAAGSWRFLRDSPGSPKGVNASVYALTVWEDMLIVGGDFTEAGGMSAGRIAAWDGDVWSAFGTGLNGAVFAFNEAQATGYLLVAGEFTRAGGETAKRFATWHDVSGWGGDADWGPGMNGPVYAIGDANPLFGAPLGVLVVGDFTVAGSSSARRFAVHDSLW